MRTPRSRHFRGRGPPTPEVEVARLVLAAAILSLLAQFVGLLKELL